MWGLSFSESNFNLLLNFILPTSERSYLSSLKKRLLNSVSAESLVGGSPGLIILYISTKASSLFEVGSALSVLDIYGPLSNSLINKQEISFTLFSFSDSITTSSISVFATKRTSPVSLLKISLDRTFPIKNSSARVISLTFALDNSLICLAVILLPASTYTLLLTFRSTGSVSPLNLSGIKASFTVSFSTVKISSS